MKTIIRLTESDLRDVITSSVKTIIKEMRGRSGYVSHDGNHMVGGSWYAKTVGCYVTMSGEELEEIVREGLNLDEETDERLWNAMVDENYTIYADFEAGADESVGISNYCDLEKVTDYDGLDTVLESVLGPELAEKALDIIFEPSTASNYDWQELD